MQKLGQLSETGSNNRSIALKGQYSKKSQSITMFQLPTANSVVMFDRARLS